MKNAFRLILLTFVSLGCFGTNPKRADAPKEDSAHYYPPTPVAIDKNAFRKYFREINDFYESSLDATGFSGSMLVAKNGQIIFEKYSGFEDQAHKDSINEHSAFHLASVSKTFTAMAILKLWENGQLNINDEVSKYLTGFNYPGVTIKSLLSHRSGLPNYVHVMENTGWDRNRMATNQDVLQFLIDNKQKLQVGAPNRGFSYCNTNYALLALVVEKVSGKWLGEFLKTTFFQPLQMNETYVYTHADSLKALPSFNWRGQREPVTFLDEVYGDKNVYCTARDLMKWNDALSYTPLFKPATLDSAYSGYSFEKPGRKNYGLGWRMYTYPNGKKLIYHNGWWHGNNTVFARMIGDSATVIILGNKFNRNIYKAKKIFPLFGHYDSEEDTEE